jgi:hypothetical protein
LQNESLYQTAKATNIEEADIQKCLKTMNDDNIKLALKKTSEDAIEYGVC